MKYHNEKLKEFLSYNEITGIFTWAKTLNDKALFGDVAGTTSNNGYNDIKIEGSTYKAHRIAMAFSLNKEPVGEVDHIDGNRLNNSLKNLRMVTRKENQRNATIRIDNKSGFCGVYWDKERGKWKSGIRVDNKTIYLGIFKEKSDAIQSRKEANIKYGFHINHGKKAHKESNNG